LVGGPGGQHVESRAAERKRRDRLALEPTKDSAADEAAGTEHDCAGGTLGGEVGVLKHGVRRGVRAG